MTEVDDKLAVFDPSVVGRYFQLFRHNVQTPMTGFTQLAKANANRVLLIVPSAPQQLAIMPGLPLTGDTGILIPVNGTHFEAGFANWGGVIGMEWNILSTGAGPLVITITEIVYYPES